MAMEWLSVAIEWLLCFCVYVIPTKIPFGTLLSQDAPQQHKVVVKLDLHVIGHVPGWQELHMNSGG